MSNLDLKKVQVDELRKVVDESLSVVAVDYRGTDVPKLTSFRKDAKDKSVFIKIIKKTEDEIKTIGVGDNYNDLDMLRNSNIACLVFNDQFLMEPININNCLVSKQSAPLGWEEVVKMALEKIK